MPFVSARCTQCGGDLQLDNEKEAGFCMHCGSKIIVQEAIRAVRIDNSHMISNWMKMGDSAIEAGNNSEAYEYFTKILEVQPDNWEATFKKGKTAGWQSTLVNLRISEATTLFGQAINLAPEDKKDEVRDISAQEVIKLALALISLRAERFVKWPDGEETAGFLEDINRIFEAVFKLNDKSGLLVKGFMRPIADRIESAVKSAYYSKIQPDYVGTEEHADEYQWRQYIERIGHCTLLLEKAIELSNEDDKSDISRYEALISMHNNAIESSSWDWDNQDWLFGKYWHKQYELADSAKINRRNLISKYQAKISRIRANVKSDEDAVKEETARKQKMEIQRKIEEYWENHTIEKAQLESEKKGLLEQIPVKQNQLLAAINPLQEEKRNLSQQVEQIATEIKGLGIFKGKEKKALQEKIDHSQKMIEEIDNNISQAKNYLFAEIDDLKQRIYQIDEELTKERG